MSNDNNNSYIEVEPSNTPEPISHHFVGDGKNWKKLSGNLGVRIYTINQDNIDESVEKVFGDFLKFLNNKKRSNLKPVVLDCKHKIYAVRYFKNSLDKEISDRVSEYKRDYRAGTGAENIRENPTLIYQTESFLFQAKSNLDVITRVMSLIFPQLKSLQSFKHKGASGTSKHVAGGKVIDSLRKSNQKSAVKIAKIIEDHRNSWIQELVEMRDKITHRSQLYGFNCFVEEPYVGKKRVRIHYPTMPSGENVKIYCNNVWYNLISLYESIFSLLRKHLEDLK